MMFLSVHMSVFLKLYTLIDRWIKRIENEKVSISNQFYYSYSWNRINKQAKIISAGRLMREVKETYRKNSEKAEEDIYNL